MESQSSELPGINENILDLDGENELVTRMRQGDGLAVKDIFNMYFDRVYTFVFYEVDKDQSVTEDIVQDTFLSAIKSAGKFKGDSHIYTWLIGIARHKIADYYRNRKREKIHHGRNDDGFEPEIMDIQDNNVSIVNFIESAEDRLLVEEALLKLPPEYRQTLVLKYVEEMPVIEISQVMNRSPKSIEGLLTRARKALRDHLEDKVRDNA